MESSGYLNDLPCTQRMNGTLSTELHRMIAQALHIMARADRQCRQYLGLVKFKATALFHVLNCDLALNRQCFARISESLSTQLAYMRTHLYHISAGSAGTSSSGPRADTTTMSDGCAVALGRPRRITDCYHMLHELTHSSRYCPWTARRALRPS